jgi:hypothetical protein
MCAPSAPNPTNTISQQTASNRETAITQSGLNMINQNTPQGNLTYQQIGTWADGTPRYEATQTLNPQGQQLFATGQQTQQNLANLAKDQSARLPGLLNAPIDFSEQRDYLEGLTAGNLDRSWDRQAQQTETDLINRGIRPGSTAYQNLTSDFRTDRSNAYNAANLSNYNSALQSQMALRAAPLNEILALAGQGQVQQPQFASTPSTGVAGTDVAGINNSAYNAQMQQYNAGQSTLGGLFSAGASLIPLFSDALLKEDIRETGRFVAGVPIKTWVWKHSGETDVGVIAQDVEKIHPQLVDRTHPSGYARVYYSRLLEEARDEFSRQ